MRKKIKTETRNVDVYADVCDVCGKELKDDNYLEWDGHTYMYGEQYGDAVEVCSLACLMKKMKTDYSYLIPNKAEDHVKLIMDSESALQIYTILAKHYG
jgi:hypothetical protein